MRLSKDKLAVIKGLIPWLWLIAGAVVMLIYHLGPGKALVDGDMGGEMILADLLNKEGDFLLSDNWYHATEIHVFFLQIVFRPLLLIWPNNWHIARVVGTFLIYAINTLGYLLMMKEAGCKRLAIWSAGALLWPLGAWRLFFGLYGAQYLVYDFFSFYIIWLLLYLCNSKGITGRRIIALITLAGLSFAGGINGVRETMMLFAPLGVGIIILILVGLFSHKDVFVELKDLGSKFIQEIKLLIIYLIALFFNLAGYVINVRVLLRKYQFQSNTNLQWKENFSFTDMLNSISDYFGLFGYSGNVKLFSVDGICSMVGVVLAVILIIITIRLVINRTQLSFGQKLILYSFVGGLFLCSTIFGLMKGMNESRFWLPFLPFGIMLLEIEGESEDWKMNGVKCFFGVAVSLMIAVTSVGAIKGQIENPHQGKAKNLVMSQFLEENGYTQGYAQYWLANTITEQTSGRVAARPVMYSETFEMMTWSNRIDYTTTYPEGEVFYVIDKKSYPGSAYDNCIYKYAGVKVVRDDDDWLVMISDNAENFEQAYKIALANGEVISQDDRVASMN